MTQSLPMRAPRAITTFAWTTLRAPTRAPSSTTTNGPIEADGSIVAPDATSASLCTPAGGVTAGVRSATAFAKARYGWGVRSTAHGAPATLSAAITADAL